VNTDATGIAIVPISANTVAGKFISTGSVAGVAANASFNLTNNPDVQQPVIDPVVQQPVIDPVVQQPVIDPVVQQPVIDPVVQQPVIDPVVQQPVIDPVVQQPVIDPVVQQPVAIAPLLPDDDTRRSLSQENSRLGTQKQPSRVSDKIAIACIFPDDAAMNSVNNLLPKIADALNSNGGTLSISVDDLLASCSKDLSGLPGNQGLIEQHILALVSKSIGAEYAKLLNIRFQNVRGRMMAIVEVKKAR
jgi:hypothetical protein